MWLDSHCHVTADEFAEDRTAVLDRAAAEGVEAFIGIGSGYGISRNVRAVDLAQQDPRVFATVGVHPHEAKDLDDAGRKELRGWLDHPRVVGLGECGLDYHYMNSEREVQRRVFAEQVSWAREHDLPVSIHVRGDAPDAFDEMLEIWVSEGGGGLEGVLHCYTGTTGFARRAIDAGFYVSFSGILTFRSADELRETARSLPLERLMVETDAPLLAPQGRRGKRNEPAWVTLVGEVLAETRSEAPKDVARATTRNARRLFRLPSENEPEPRGDA